MQMQLHSWCTESKERERPKVECECTEKVDKQLDINSAAARSRRCNSLMILASTADTCKMHSGKKIRRLPLVRAMEFLCGRKWVSQWSFDQSQTSKETRTESGKKLRDRLLCCFIFHLLLWERGKILWRCVYHQNVFMERDLIEIKQCPSVLNIHRRFLSDDCFLSAVSRQNLKRDRIVLQKN